MVDPIAKTPHVARSFNLASAVNGMRLRGKFQQIANSPRSSPMGTPLAHASGEYYKQCTGAALSAAREVMAELKDVPGQRDRHVAALSKSIEWASPGVGQHYDQIVLSRLTILGAVHAGLSDLLGQSPGDATLISLHKSVKNAIGNIGVLGGQGERPETGTYRAESKSSKKFTDVLRKAEGCVVDCMQKQGAGTLVDAIARAVVAEPLLRALEARNPEMYDKLLQDSGSKLDLMQALSRTWSDKLQANVADLLDSGDYEHIEVAILQVLNIPDIVLQSEHGKPAPADNPRPPQAPPGIPQSMLDKAGNGGVFYNYSPNTTEIRMDGFLKELFGQLKDFGGGGFKAGELLGVFNLMNDQFAASRDMLIEHGKLQERVQNQLNINKAQNNELQSAFDRIHTLTEKLRQRDAALEAFAARGNRRDSNTESVVQLGYDGRSSMGVGAQKAHVPLVQAGECDPRPYSQSDTKLFSAEKGWGRDFEFDPSSNFPSPPPAYTNEVEGARKKNEFEVQDDALSTTSADSGLEPDGFEDDVTDWRDDLGIHQTFFTTFGADGHYLDQVQQKARTSERNQEANASDRLSHVDTDTKVERAPSIIGSVSDSEISRMRAELGKWREEVRSPAPGPEVPGATITNINVNGGGQRDDARVPTQQITSQWVADHYLRNSGASPNTADQNLVRDAKVPPIPPPKPSKANADAVMDVNHLQGSTNVSQLLFRSTRPSQSYDVVTSERLSTTSTDPGDGSERGRITEERLWKAYTDKLGSKSAQPDAPRYVKVGDAKAVIGSPSTLNGHWNVLVEDFSSFASENGLPLNVQPPVPNLKPKPEGGDGELQRFLARWKADNSDLLLRNGKIGRVAADVKKEMDAEAAAAGAALRIPPDEGDAGSQTVFEADRSRGPEPVEASRLSIQQALIKLSGPSPIQLHHTNPFLDDIRALATKH